MISFRALLSDESVDYDGTQLATHWIYRRFDVMGNALVAFLGGANVEIEHMVDLEDVKKIAPIYSPRMLHFLAEFFMDSLDTGILLQQLLVCNVYELCLERGLKEPRRSGNDIYSGDRKFSVSIATKSPVSVLLHMGINVETKGTPVPTIGLADLGLEPTAFAREVMERFSADCASAARARVKVLPR